jgi:hypothetical protein
MEKRPGCADAVDLLASWCECRITARREARDAFASRQPLPPERDTHVPFDVDAPGEVLTDGGDGERDGHRDRVTSTRSSFEEPAECAGVRTTNWR